MHQCDDTLLPAAAAATNCCRRRSAGHALSIELYLFWVKAPLLMIATPTRRWGPRTVGAQHKKNLTSHKSFRILQKQKKNHITKWSVLKIQQTKGNVTQKGRRKRRKMKKKSPFDQSKIFLCQFLFHSFKVYQRVNLMPYILISGLLPMISHLLKIVFLL